MKPYCFVAMPFGIKSDDSARAIHFDDIYKQVIGPAIIDADLEPIRADEEAFGGLIHKPMFERLMLCDYTVVDLTTANPNVLYELGIRHGIRPHSTVLIFAKGSRLPFDVAPLRALPYTLDRRGRPAAVAEDRKALAQRLNECRTPSPDSPLFQLVDGWPPPDMSRLKTDTFRDSVEYSRAYKEKLRVARSAGAAAVRDVETELGRIADADPAIVVDLFLSYRAVEDWQAMIASVQKMSPVLARTVMVREQLAFALNRAGESEKAQTILEELIAERGSSSETSGLLGRVYKDRWDEARKAGQQAVARGHLRKAIDTYLAGFEADWRDAYPGINAITLLIQNDPDDPRLAELVPVVRYAVKRRLATRDADYWDHATALELAVHASDRADAADALSDALAVAREQWEPRTTARNLKLIRESREARHIDAKWIEALEQELENATNRLAGS